MLINSYFKCGNNLIMIKIIHESQMAMIGHERKVWLFTSKSGITELK